MGDKTARDTWTTLTHEEKTCILDALKRLAFIVVMSVFDIAELPEL